MKKLCPIVKLRGLGYSEPVYAHLIERTENKAIYSVKHPDGVTVYEVFKVLLKRKPIYENGKFIGEGELGESYPKNEDFGKTAWCYKYSGNAWKKYEEL